MKIQNMFYFQKSFKLPPRVKLHTFTDLTSNQYLHQVLTGLQVTKTVTSNHLISFCLTVLSVNGVTDMNQFKHLLTTFTDEHLTSGLRSLLIG